MPTEFCGYLNSAPDLLGSWDHSLRARHYGRVTWAGDAAGHTTEDATAVLYLPGEARSSTQIYNDGDALAALCGVPYALDGAEPTETPPLPLAAIVQRIADNGPAALTGIGGSFALVVIFPRRNELLLAVDRFAVENLFYVADPGGIAFATRALNLASHPRIDHCFRAQAIYDYLYFHCLPGPDAGFENMERLLPGHYLHVQDSRHQVSAYWQPAYTENTAASLSSLAARLPDIIQAAVTRRQGHGPTACFLSGGLDSSTITGMCAKRRPGEVTAFTIGFDAAGYDEMEFARSVARHFNVEHAHYYVTPRDIVHSLPDIVGAFDGPFGNASAVPTYFCARLAREHGFSSIMAGDGGDELFGGNSRYATQLLFEHYYRIPKFLRQKLMEPVANGLPMWARWGMLGKGASYVRQASVPLPDRLMTYNLLNWIRPDSFLTADFLEEIDTRRPVARLREMYQHEPGTALVNQLLHLDWRLTLADSDLPKVCSMTALAGIHVSFPMLDEAVFEFAAMLPAAAKLKNRTLRPLYRAAFNDFLPQSTLTKSKQGFGMPFGVWLRENEDLKAFASAQLESLHAAGLLKGGFRESFMSGKLHDHPAFFGTLMWVLMTLGIWLRSSSIRF